MRAESPRPPRRPALRAGFTLVEVLSVITMLAILSGLVFAVGRGVTNSSRKSQAQAELATLSTALEAYKGAYADYPRVDVTTSSAGVTSARTDTNPLAAAVPASPNATTDRAYELFRALGGRYNPNRGILTANVGGNLVNKYGRAFLDFGAFRFERSAANGFPVPAATANADDPDFINALVDPWGNRYVYVYRTYTNNPRWTNPSFVLLSAGKDGIVNSTIAADGTLTALGDDIIAGRP